MIKIDVMEQELKKVTHLAELIAFAIKNEGEYKEINFGTIPNFQAQIINQETHLKVNGAVKV